ncbi:hypothetical protein BSKO_13980 [Bryopsis sp. KO-2023]|nr:hypothetical protein BSKO_13980 [Bryopsis sp. KO-2023]
MCRVSFEVVWVVKNMGVCIIWKGLGFLLDVENSHHMVEKTNGEKKQTQQTKGNDTLPIDIAAFCLSGCLGRGAKKTEKKQELIFR